MAMAGPAESIYNIIPPKPVVVEKPPMFRSKIPGNLPPTASTFHAPNTTNPVLSNMAGTALTKVVRDRSHAEFGRPMGSYSNKPDTFMKKFAKSSSVPSLRYVKATNPDQLKPKHLKESRFGPGGGGPPKKGEAPVMNLVTSKNFIVANAVEVILAQPKKIQDTTKDFLKKDRFGKVPKYLTHIKNDIAREMDYIRQLQDQHFEDTAPPVQPMDDVERQRLLDGLKTKWEAVNQEYQAMTHLSLLERGQLYRKEKFEAELSQIEKDIERLGKKNIHIDLSR